MVVEKDALMTDESPSPGPAPPSSEPALILEFAAENSEKKEADVEKDSAMKIDSSMSFDEKLAVRVHNMSQCAGCALVAVGTALRHTSLCASLHLSLLLSRRVTLVASA